MKRVLFGLFAFTFVLVSTLHACKCCIKIIGQHEADGKKKEMSEEYCKKLKVLDIPKVERWKRSGNTVIDTKLGLEWQDDSRAETQINKWSSAKEYCKNLALVDKRDWRLPSYDELLTIVDYDRYNCAIVPSFENVTSLGYYWSSSPYVTTNKDAWAVNFKSGVTDNYYKINKNYVRCVRGRQ